MAECMVFFEYTVYPGDEMCFLLACLITFGVKLSLKCVILPNVAFLKFLMF